MKSVSASKKSTLQIRAFFPTRALVSQCTTAQKYADVSLYKHIHLSGMIYSKRLIVELHILIFYFKNEEKSNPSHLPEK